jgi:AcrR family transcriptional regulator
VAARGPRRTQRERSESTVALVLDAARELFAESGYAATSLEAIAAAAGVTKGAVYHHFANKREVFRAVYERERLRLAAIESRAFASARDPWDGFVAAALRYLEECLDPGVQRITLIDAPGALGWETMRELFERDTAAPMRLALEAAMQAGRLRRRPVDPIVHLLHGAITETAMEIARAGDQRAAHRAAARELRRLLDALADERRGDG